MEPYLFDYLRAVREEREAQGDELTPEEHTAIEEQYIVRLKTLGPLGVAPGTFEHWNTFESDLAQTAELGWITDPALLASLQASLTAARAAVLVHNGPQAIAHLQAMIGAIEGSTESQRSSEGYALVRYNAESLRDRLPIPVESPVTPPPPRP